MVNEKEILIESIKSDFKIIESHLKEITQRVIDESISTHPIFIASQEMVDIGRPILDRNEVQVNWFFNVSIMEDFVRKGLIQSNKTSEFKRTHGDPLEKACIFVIVGEEGQFLFVPYDEIDE